ncbi:MAG: hypothetical protein GY899_13075 [Verrucomicrobiaceae bacterium]|nr:hypothetical protein [Verrucomicrobiaceae bacterium]
MLRSICLLFAASMPVMAKPVVDNNNFNQLHSLIQPTEEETRWLQIPWRTSLWQARIEAAITGKPIYLWEMDGHPLGCT